MTDEVYKNLISERTERIKTCIFNCLAKAQLEASEIDIVLKVGGSSKNRFIDDILFQIFGNKVQSKDIFTSVTAGLSVAANDIFR